MSAAAEPSGPDALSDTATSDNAASPRYRTHLTSVVSATAAPYGYTLSLWAAGTLAIGAAGRFPTTVDVLLLVGGAVVGFGVLAAITFGGLNRALDPAMRARIRAWGGVHIPALGAGVTASTVLVHTVHGHLLWPLLGFSVTTVYLCVLAAQYWLASRVWKRSRRLGRTASG